MDGLDHAFGFSTEPGTGLPDSGTWVRLARAVGADAESVDPKPLVEKLNASDQGLSLAPLVYEILRDLILDPPYDPSGPTKYYERADEFIAPLKPAILSRALAGETNLSARKKFITEAVQRTSPESVYVLARAAGAAYDRPLSKVLDALVRKLTTGATTLPEGVKRKAESTLRSLVRHIVETWSAGTVDTSSTGYENLFTEEAGESAPTGVRPEPERVVQLSLETGAVGPALWNAVATLSEGERMRDLLGMLKAAPPDSRAGQLIAQQFANPQRLLLLLREEDVDFDSVDALLRHMGTAAAEPMLEVLTTSSSRQVRRALLDRINALGPEVGSLVVDRLHKDERWFVTRNMLHVLNATNADLRNVNLAQYQNHSDARVRREAMGLLFKDPIARDRALATAFKDTDPFMIRTALRSARGGLPDVAVPVLAKRLLDADYPPEFRLPSIQLLGRSKSVLALDTLLKYVQGGTSLLGKPKLANKSPEMLAALKGLARTWPQERRARVLLEVAATVKDPQISAALQAPSAKAEEDDDVVE